MAEVASLLAKDRRALIFLCFLIVLAPAALCAQAAAGGPAEPVVLVLVRAADQQENAQLSSFIAATVELELGRAGMMALPEDGPQRGGGGPPAPEGVLAAAKAAEADFALTALYESTGDRVRTRFGWYDVGREELVAEVTRSHRIGLNADTVVIDAVEELIFRSLDRIKEVAGIRAARAAEAARRAQAEEAARAAEEAARREKAPPAPVPPAARPAAERARFRVVELSLGFAPFLAVGQASRYFPLGYLPSLYVSFRMPVGFGTVGLGVAAGVNAFQAEGLLASSMVELVPAGVEIRVALALGTVMGAYLRFSGGPALLVLNSTAEGPRAKLLPFAQGGLGLSVALTRAFGFSVEGTYVAFFEQGYPIMGVAPSAYLFVRL